MAFTKTQQAAIDLAVAEQIKLREDCDRAAAEHQAQLNNQVVSDASFRESLASMFGGFEMPSGKRVIISLVASVVLGGIAGFLGAQLVAMMVAYAATLTTSAFLLFMIQFVGYALTIMASVFIGGKLQALILDGGIDRSFSKTKDYITGLFATKVVAS